MYTPNDDNVNLDDYNVEISYDLYNQDYDVVDVENQQEETSQTDILFE